MYTKCRTHLVSVSVATGELTPVCDLWLDLPNMEEHGSRHAFYRGPMREVLWVQQVPMRDQPGERCPGRQVPRQMPSGNIAMSLRSARKRYDAWGCAHIQHQKKRRCVRATREELEFGGPDLCGRLDAIGR